MKKRIYSIVVILLLVFTCVVGCSRNDDTTAKLEDKGNTKDEASSVEEKVTLQLWHYISQGDLDDFEKIVNDYNASQDRVEVISTYVSRDDLSKQYTMGAISGELPDIGQTDSPNMAALIQLGVYENITNEVMAWGEIDNFFSGPLSTVKDDAGDIYGLPHNSNSILMFYNKDKLAEAGYAEPPTTWEELEEVAAATTTSDTYGFTIAAAANETTTFHYYPWLYSAGGAMEELDSEASIKALSFLTNLINKGYMSKEVINWGNGDAIEEFKAGKVAMVINGTWQVPSLRGADLPFEWGVAAIPMDQKKATVIGGENFGICTGTKYKEEAFEFLTYMMSAQNNADFCEAAGKIPVRSDATKLKDVWTKDPVISVFANSLEYAVARGPHPQWPSISKAIQDAVHASFLGAKTPEEALRDAAEVVNDIK